MIMRGNGKMQQMKSEYRATSQFCGLSQCRPLNLLTELFGGGASELFSKLHLEHVIKDPNILTLCV